MLRVLLLSCRVAGAAFALAMPLSIASAADVINGEAADFSQIGKAPTGGEHEPNPRVRAILAAHPNQDVVLCLAGCRGKTLEIVQILPRPVTRRTSEFVPSSSDARGAGRADENNDVICVAGCIGRPGEIVQRMPNLPAPPKVAPRPGKHGNEPLDVLP